MEFKNINCPECGLNIEYWTKNNFIECTKCKHVINLSYDESVASEAYNDCGTCDDCEFHLVYYDEIDGELYHDGCYCSNEKQTEDDYDYHCECCYDVDTDIECPYFHPSSSTL